MPVMDGYEASRRISGLQLTDRMIPKAKIIAITANVASNDWDRCRAAGMHSYLTKPIIKSLFKETLEKNLGFKFINV